MNYLEVTQEWRRRIEESVKKTPGVYTVDMSSGGLHSPPNTAFTVEGAIDAISLVTEDDEELRFTVAHSEVVHRMRSNNLITFDADGGLHFLNRPLLIDNRLPVHWNVYETWFFGERDDVMARLLTTEYGEGAR